MTIEEVSDPQFITPEFITSQGFNETIIQRFLAKIKQGPVLIPWLGNCWIWTGARKPKWHGRIITRLVTRQNAKRINSHVLAWILKFGPIPPGLRVCHLCDNPPCVRWSHLWIGTSADNNRDMVAKGREFY